MLITLKQLKGYSRFFRYSVGIMTVSQLRNGRLLPAHNFRELAHAGEFINTEKPT